METTISVLNGDCLMHIFNFLDFEDQINLLHLCVRFNEVITEIWRPKFKALSIKDLNVPSFSPLKWATINLRAFVEELDLDCITPNDLDNLKLYQYPKTTSLKCELYHLLLDGPRVGIEIIGDIFPKLTTLSLCTEMHIPDNAFVNLQQNLTVLEIRVNMQLRLENIFSVLKLRKLSVEYVNFATFFHSKQDFDTIVKCATLEEIAFNAELLELLVPKILQLPKLRMISYIFKWVNVNLANLMQKIAENIHKGKVTLVKYPLLNRSLHLTDMVELRNVQILILRGFFFHNTSPGRCAACDGLKKILNADSQSTKTFQDSFIVNELINILNVFKDLEVLIVPVYPISELQIEELAMFLRNQKDRKRPLELRRYINNLDNLPFNNQWYADVLQLTYTPFPIEYDTKKLISNLKYGFQFIVEDDKSNVSA